METDSANCSIINIENHISAKVPSKKVQILVKKAVLLHLWGTKT